MAVDHWEVLKTTLESTVERINTNGKILDWTPGPRIEVNKIIMPSALLTVTRQRLEPDFLADYTIKGRRVSVSGAGELVKEGSIQSGSDVTDRPTFLLDHKASPRTPESVADHLLEICLHWTDE